MALRLVEITVPRAAADEVVGTFLLQKVRPRTWWEAERAQRATCRAVTTWVIMLLVLVAIIVLRQRPAL